MIFLHGDINSKLINSFVEQLKDHKHEDIAISLYSQGGNIYDALALYGIMRTSNKKFAVYAFGAIFSAATILLAGAHIRGMHQDAWFMVHDSPSTKKGKKADIHQSEREEDQWADILARHSQLPADQWRKLSQKETYLTALECYQYGIIDEIMKG